MPSFSAVSNQVFAKDFDRIGLHALVDAGIGPLRVGHEPVQLADVVVYEPEDRSAEMRVPAALLPRCFLQHQDALRSVFLRGDCGRERRVAAAYYNDVVVHGLPGNR
jgi:hypothetical protein